MKSENSNETLVISIGASAGGTSALKSFFSNYTLKTPALVIIQHTDVEAKDLARETIHSFTHLPVEEAKHGQKISSGRVYISPPHKLLSVEKNTFVVQDPGESSQRFATIDFFMNSLATAYKEKAVGIVLSGEGMDGTMGLKAISDHGGLTLVQSAASAEHVSMPETASEFGFVDHIITPKEMGEALASYKKFLSKLDKSTTITQLKEEIGAALISICDILHRHTLHDFKHYKTSTLVRRIQRRMMVLQIDNVAEYVNLLNDKNNELNSLFNDLLINVTSFFRDPEAFEALKQEVLIPDFKKFTGSKKYRIWVSGCSTGEEPYTLAMLVKETLEELQLKIDVQIIATDIDEEALNIARKGEYPLSITDKVSPQRLEKFFQRKNGRFSISKKLREMILFSSHNLINDPPFSQVDLISCRNVLIYLGLHLQKKLIPVFHYALKSNGHLFLGTSESLTSHKDLFHPLNTKHRIAQRKATAISAPSQSFFTSMTTSYTGHFKEAPQSHEEDLHLIGQRIMLDEFAPKFAIIGDECQILDVSIGISDYLEPAEGTFQNNILKLVKQNLRAPLRMAINEAKKQKRQIQNQSTIIRTDKGLIKIGIVVQPMPQLGEHTGLYMVVFRDLGIVSDDVQSHATDRVDFTMVEELERELAKLRNELEKSVQDLEASNEELKSSNEELLSMNEELQSTNEELEVSKEEVQKGNEILTNANTDLENLLNSTKIATIFLDKNLTIKSFTPAISQIYELVSHDIGRPLASFASKAVKMPPYSYPNDLKLNQVVETEVLIPDGKIFLRRKSPYYNQNKEMVGLVVTFVDVTELRNSEQLFKTLSNTVPQMIFSTDHQGNYIYFSNRWLDYTGLDPVTIKNKGFRDIVHPEDLPGAMEEWTHAQTSQSDNFKYQYRLKNKNGEYRWHLVTASSVKDHNNQIYRWFGGCTDIQDQKEMELALLNRNREILRSQERFKGIADAIDMGVWYCNLPFDVLNWSHIVKKHFWLPPEAHVTIDTFYEYIHPDDRLPTKTAIDYSIKNQTHYDTNYRTINPKTGEFKWIRAIGWTDYDEEGLPTRFDGVTFDITESTVSFNTLRDNEWKYSMASKAARELIWDWNLTNNQVKWNEAISTQFGYPTSAQDTDGDWWINHIHHEDRQRVSDSIHHAIDTHEPFWNDEYRFLKADGTYAMVMDQGYIQIDDGKAIRMIGSMYDVTEQTEYMDKMKEAIKARDEFLSIASHELKTPLTSMILQMQMLQRKIERGHGTMPMVLQANDLLLKQCRILTSLIDDMLDVSRITNGKMNFNFQRESLKSIVESSLDFFAINIEEKDIHIEVDLQDNVWAKVDPFRVEQVISNLLSNAVKYGQGKPFKVSVYKEGQMGVIEVADQGLGISQESIEKIFNLFERAVASVNISGLGLGLYISKQIVDAHGGEIVVQSELSKGSVFKVLFPLS